MSRIKRALFIILIITLFSVLVLVSCNKEELPNNGDNTSGENSGAEGGASSGDSTGDNTGEGAGDGSGGSASGGTEGGTSSGSGTVNNKPSEGLEFTLSSDGTYYEVSGIGTCTDKHLIIPSEYNGKPVKAIGERAFYDCEGLTSITIPNSVTSIGYRAFEDCTGLTSVTIPNSVKSIGYYAFEGCYKLVEVITSLNITKGSSDYEYIAYYALEVHQGESKIVNKNGYLFYTYNGVNYLVNYIGNDTVLTLPESYNGESYKIYACAFYKNKDIISIIVPNSVTSIGYEAFRGCTGLTSVTIGNSVTSIGSYAFYNCKELTSVTIPDSVTSIGYRAFEDCTGLTSVTIPNSVTSIGYEAFNYCNKLVEVINKSSLNITKGSENNGKIAYYALEVHQGESKIVNKNGYLFYTYNGVNYLVNYIGNDTVLTLPESYKIYKYAFYENENITSITIPNSVTSIGKKAFSGCTGLTSVTIGNSVTSIDGSAFSGCTGLTEINFNAESCADMSFDSNVFYNAGTRGSGITVTFGDSVKKIPKNLFEGCSKIKSVTIGKNVTSIGKSAFDCCRGLTSITIPNSVTSIGKEAFSGCDGLTSITVPDSVTSIGYRAFYYTGYYKNESNWEIGVLYIGKYLIEAKSSKSGSYTVKDGTLCIADDAFYQCTKLTSVIIPDSVTSIGEYAFEYCTELKTIKYRGTEAQWKAVSKGYNWNYNTGSYTVIYNYTGE